MTTCVQPEWITPSMLRLTRRALAAFPRWREAATDLTRRNWEQACGLHQGEIVALRTLTANLAACGPTSGWLKLPSNLAAKSKPKPGLLELLLHGLRLDEDALPDFLRLAQFTAPIHARWFEEALREHLGMPEAEKKKPQPAERVSFTAECAKLTAADEKTTPWARQAAEGRKQRKETEMTTGAATVSEPAGPKLTPTERSILTALEKRGAKIRGIVSMTTQREIAREVGCGNLSFHLANIRRKMGINLGDTSQERPEVQSAPPPILADPAVDVPTPAADGATVPTEGPELRVSPLSLDLTSYRQEIENLRRAVEAKRTERDETARMLAEVQRERDDAQEQLTASLAEARREREVSGRLHGRLDAVETERHEAVKRAQEEVARLQALLAETNERCVALETRVTGGQLPALADDDRQIALRLACGLEKDLCGMTVSQRATIAALVVDILGAALR